VERPSPAILASILLHGGLAALALVSWPTEAPRELDLRSAVPVSIVSDVEIASAPADNPQPESSPADAATAPPPPAPEPVPQPPTPTPPPPRPAPTPAPRKTPPQPTPPRPQPTPPRPQPPQPRPATPAKDTATLDLSTLTGPNRPRPNSGQNAAAGQQGQGQAPQATGPLIAAIASQVYQNWNLTFCSLPGGDDLRVRMEFRLSAEGRIVAGPTLIDPQSSAVYRAAADSAVRALRVSAPFDVPEGFTGAVFRPTFNTDRACRNR